MSALVDAAQSECVAVDRVVRLQLPCKEWGHSEIWVTELTCFFSLAAMSAVLSQTGYGSTTSCLHMPLSHLWTLWVSHAGCTPAITTISSQFQCANMHYFYPLYHSRHCHTYYRHHLLLVLYINLRPMLLRLNILILIYY